MAEETKPAKRKVWTVYGIVALVLLLALILAIFSGSVILRAGPAALRAARRAQAANEINQIQTACLGYYTEYAQMPDSPENSRLIKSLTGDSPRKIQFLSLNPRDLNSKGEMIDPWGTPFRITFDADSTVHVTSAGPDKVFGTADDLTNQ